MAVVSEITVHDCSFVSRPCENYTCRQAANKKKYFIGNPNAFGQKPIYCEDCIKHLASHLPAELVSGGKELEANLRASITKEYDVILADRIKEAVEAERRSLAMIIAAEHSAQLLVEEAPEEEPEIIEEPKEPQIFRCLDCNDEFTSAIGLRNHKRKHESS